MVNFWKRLWAYARGDFSTAAGASTTLVEAERDLPWLDQHNKDDTFVDYALAAAQRSSSFAEEAAGGLKSQASTLIPLVMGVLALALGGTGLALQNQHSPRWLGPASVVMFLIVDSFIILAAIHSFLATAPAYAGGLNIRRLSSQPSPQLRDLKIQEVLAWHEGGLRAMEIGARRGSDLFTARRCLLAAVVLALPAMMLTSVGTLPAGDGQPSTGVQTCDRSHHGSHASP